MVFASCAITPLQAPFFMEKLYYHRLKSGSAPAWIEVEKPVSIPARTGRHGATAPRETQVPVAHEFGHAIGNTAVLSRGDEYRPTSPNVADHQSIMHHGHRLRSRHFQTILDEMNQMISGARFSVASVS
jgi:hypothetical protein